MTDKTKSSDDTFFTVAKTATELGVGYAAHVAGASFSVATGAVFLATNTVEQARNDGDKYIANYESAKNDGYTDRQASDYASMMDRPMGE
jgi:hypothetical protein